MNKNFSSLNGYGVKDTIARKYNNIEEIKDLPLVEGDIISTIGYYEANDGGGATYKIRKRVIEDVENGRIIFIGELLVAELIIENPVNIKQFGVIGNGDVDDTLKIEDAIKVSNNLIIDCVCLCGEITIEKPITIKGKGKLIQKDETLFNIASENVNISNISINGNNKSYSININSNNVNIENCKFEGSIGHYIISNSVKNSNIISNIFDCTNSSCVTPVLFNGSSDSKCIKNKFNNISGFGVQTRLGANNIIISDNNFNNEFLVYEIIATEGQSKFEFETGSEEFERKNYIVNNEMNDSGDIKKYSKGYIVEFEEGLSDGDRVKLYLTNSLEPININSRSYNIKISNNFINGSGDSGIVICSDYHNDILNPGITTSEDYPSKIEICNNTIKNVFYSGVANTTGCENIIIKSNTIESCGLGINIYSSNYNSCINVSDGIGIIIEGNILIKNENDHQCYGIVIRPLSDINKKYNVVSNNIYVGEFTKRKTSFASGEVRLFSGIIDNENSKDEYEIFKIDSNLSIKPSNTDFMSYENSGGNGIILDEENALINGRPSFCVAPNCYVQGKFLANEYLTDSIITIEFDGKSDIKDEQDGYLDILYKINSNVDFASKRLRITSDEWKHYKFQVITGSEVFSLLLRIGRSSNTSNLHIQNLKCFVQKIN